LAAILYESNIKGTIMYLSRFNGFFLACGLAASGYFISQTLYNSEVAANTAEVKGLAERQVKADMADWELYFTVSTIEKGALPKLYKDAQFLQNELTKLLQIKGFNDHEIELGVIDYQKQEFRNKDQKLIEQKHSLIGSITVSTNQVDLVAKVRADVNELIAKGIEIDNRAPIFRFTQLNNIKPEMLKEATSNARTAANEFAQIAGVKVGSIKSARQGNFSIRDRGQSYNDNRNIVKDVRVVTTISFYLQD
jgi:hypothetical protein